MALFNTIHSSTSLSLINQWISLHKFGRFDEAIATLKDYINREPDTWIGYVGLSILYVRLGMEEEAHKLIDKLRQFQIEFSIDQIRQTAIYKDASLIEDAVDALRKVGLK